MSQVASDRDSFATFTGGLRENWIFVGAVFAAAMWLFNGQSDARNVDTIQQTAIDANAAQITALESKLDDLEQSLNDKFDEAADLNAEVIRRLDSVQREVEIINANTK
jgi:exonuclease VII small subunit